MITTIDIEPENLHHLIISNVLRQMFEKVPRDIYKELENILLVELSDYDISARKKELLCVEDSWRKFLEMFLVRKYADGLKQSTLDYYNLILSQMLTRLNMRVQDITDSDVAKYLLYYKTVRKVTNATLENMRRCFSSFFSWLNDRGFITRNPIKTVSAIKQDKKLKEPFSSEEIERLKRCTTDKRTLAIIEVLRSTGVRVSELCAIRLADVDFERNEIRIYFGKGGKERVVYFSSVCKMWLNRYLASRHDNCPYLFVSEGKGSIHGIKKCTVQEIMRQIGAKAKVPNTHAHRFRRTFATNMLAQGMSIEQLAILMGHEQIETTMIYCKINQNSIKYNYQKCVGF